MNSPKCINILQWNAQSLYAQEDELKHHLCKSQNKVDIICIQESWLKPSKSYNIPGYNSIRCDRLSKSGGGTVIYIHPSHSYHEIKIDSAIECCAVEFKIKSEWITAQTCINVSKTSL